MTKTKFKKYECPECGEEMWNNTFKKKKGEVKSTYPDLKCKDTSCGHAIWFKKEDKKKENKSMSTNGDGVYNEVPLGMYTAWAKDIVIAFVNKGTIKTEKQAFEKLEKYITIMGKIVNKPEGSIKKKNKVKEEEPEEVEEEEVEEDSADEKVDLDDLNLDDLD